MQSVFEAKDAGAKQHMMASNAVQAIVVYDVSGHAIAGPASLLDFFGGNNNGGFSDISCERPCASALDRPSTCTVTSARESNWLSRRGLPAGLVLSGLHLQTGGFGTGTMTMAKVGAPAHESQDASAPLQACMMQRSPSASTSQCSTMASMEACTWDSLSC